MAVLDLQGAAVGHLTIELLSQAAELLNHEPARHFVGDLKAARRIRREIELGDGNGRLAPDTRSGERIVAPVSRRAESGRRFFSRRRGVSVAALAGDRRGN